MALVERLMGLEEPKIPVHDFFAAQQQVIKGNITVTQVKSFLNMDAACAAEYDALVALYPTGTTAAAYFNKTQYIQDSHSVFLLAENRYPGYSTPAEVRAKLGI
jgi:hypothetical protein